jgi:hypothetical protein
LLSNTALANLQVLSRSADWWEKLTPVEQKLYIKQHPETHLKPIIRRIKKPAVSTKNTPSELHQWTTYTAPKTRAAGAKFLHKSITDVFSKAYPDTKFKTWTNKDGDICASSDPKQWGKDKPNLDPENSSGRAQGPWGVVMSLESGVVDKQRTVMLRVKDASAGKFKGVFGPVMSQASQWAKDHAKEVGATNAVLLPTNDVSGGYWKSAAKKNSITYRTDRRPL